MFRVWRFEAAREDGRVLVKRFHGVNYGTTVGYGIILVND